MKARPNKAKKLTIFITSSEEPVAINGFVEGIIANKHAQIVGLGLIDKTGPSWKVIERKKRRVENVPTARQSLMARCAVLLKGPSGALRAFRCITTIALIFGLWETLRQGARVALFQVRILISQMIPSLRSPSIRATAQKYNVPVYTTRDVNDPKFIALLRELRPDIIINQAPGILRAEFLAIPTVGVLNRHNALLPRNRGRLSPFWTIYNGESTGGVSIHFVTEALDAGSIVVQHRIELAPNESARSLAWKCYVVAPAAMLEAIEKLENGEYQLIPNPISQATHNSNPTLEDAFRYRCRRITSGLRRIAVSDRGTRQRVATTLHLIDEEP